MTWRALGRVDTARHVIGLPFNSRNDEGSKRVSMTWRAIFSRPYIEELTDVGLMHRGSREAIVGRMRELCRVGQDQKKFAACLEARPAV